MPREKSPGEQAFQLLRNQVRQMDSEKELLDKFHNIFYQNKFQNEEATNLINDPKFIDLFSNNYEFKNKIFYIIKNFNIPSNEAINFTESFFNKFRVSDKELLKMLSSVLEDKIKNMTFYLNIPKVKLLINSGQADNLFLKLLYLCIEVKFTTANRIYVIESIIPEIFSKIVVRNIEDFKLKINSNIEYSDDPYILYDDIKKMLVDLNFSSEIINSILNESTFKAQFCRGIESGNISSLLEDRDFINSMFSDEKNKNFFKYRASEYIKTYGKNSDNIANFINGLIELNYISAENIVELLSIDVFIEADAETSYEYGDDELKKYLNIPKIKEFFKTQVSSHNILLKPILSFAIDSTRYTVYGIKKHVKLVENLIDTSFDDFFKKNIDNIVKIKSNENIPNKLNFIAGMKTNFIIFGNLSAETINQLANLIKLNIKEDFFKKIKEIAPKLEEFSGNSDEYTNYINNNLYVNSLIASNVFTLEEINNYLKHLNKLVNKKDLLLSVINDDNFIENISANFKLIEQEISKNKKLIYALIDSLTQQMYKSLKNKGLDPQQKEIYKSLINLVKDSGSPYANSQLNYIYEWFAGYFSQDNPMFNQFKDLKETFEKKSNFATYKKRYNDVWMSNPNNLTSVEVITQEEIINNRTVTKNYLPQKSKDKILETYFIQSPFIDQILTGRNTKSQDLSKLQELEKLTIHLFEKKDFFYLNNLQFFGFFSKNTSIISKWTESFSDQILSNFVDKKNIDPIKFYESFAKNNYEGLARLHYLLNVDIKNFYTSRSVAQLLESIINKSQDVDKYLKYLEKISILAKIEHDQKLQKYLLEKAVTNDSFSVTLQTNIDFLSIINSLLLKTNLYINEGNKDTIFDQLINQDIIDDINRANDAYKELVQKTYIDLNNFINNVKSIQTVLDKFVNNKPLGISNEIKNTIRFLLSDMAKIEKFDVIQRYVVNALPKDKKIYDLNTKLTDNIEFKVLEFLDPYTFQVGIDTNCCQRFPGIGESAAVDSFINPLAGILTLYFNDDLISQSYFHYVPQDNGIILDNIESSPQNTAKYNISKNILSKIYADYAQQIKNKLNLNYVKCGMDFNKINNDLFKQLGRFNNENPDPRHFEVEQQQLTGSEGKILFKYTDCKFGLIDLLQPNKQLDNVSYPNFKKSNYSPKLLKFAIRANKLNMALHQNDISKSLVRMLWLQKQCP